MTIPTPRAAVLSAAVAEFGVPYSYGGGGIHGPSYGIDQGALVQGYDCASLMQRVFYVGSKWSALEPVRFLARGSVAQSKEGLHVGSTYADIAKAQIGDVVFFNNFGHVGLLSGHAIRDPWGNLQPQIIHAAHTGTVVGYELVYPNEPQLAVCAIHQYLPRERGL